MDHLHPFVPEASNADVLAYVFRPPQRRYRADKSKTFKLKRFGLGHFLLCFIAICYQVMELKVGSGTWMPMGGIACYAANGSLALVSAWKPSKSLLIALLVAAMGETLYALAWVSSYQVLLVTSQKDRPYASLASAAATLNLSNLGPGDEKWEDSDAFRSTLSFHWFLAGQYLLIGLGAALSVSTAAMVIVLLKERTHEEVELAAFPKKVFRVSSVRM